MHLNILDTKIIERVNHEAWAKTKRRIIEIPEDNQTLGSQEKTVVYNNVLNDVNHVTWRMTKENVVDPSEDKSKTQQYGIIRYSDVLYDVDFTTWKVAQVRIADTEQRYEAQTDSENTRWFRRQYKVAVEHVIDILRPYITVSSDVNEASDNTLNFRFPTSWTGSITALMSYAHHYIVDFIIYEWFRMTMPSDSSAYLTTSEDWKQKMINEAHSENKNVEWFNSQYITALEQVRDRMRAYIYLDAEPEASDYTFRFRFPIQWRGNLSSIHRYIHKYVVNTILAEWFGMNLSINEKEYSDAAADWMRQLTEEAQSEYDNYDWFVAERETSINRITDILRWCARKNIVIYFHGIFNSNDEDWSLNTVDYAPHFPNAKVVFDPASGKFCMVGISSGTNAPEMKAVFYTKFDGYEKYEEGAIYYNIFDGLAYSYSNGKLSELKDKQIDSEGVRIDFTFSPSWKGNLEALGNYIHRYIVDYILYEWFKITSPSEAAVYLASAEQWESKVINEARSEDVRDVYFRL